MSEEVFLVTGCAGFIGGHMLEYLVAAGNKVVGIDDFSTGSPDNMRGVEGKFTFMEGSLCEPALAAKAVAGVDRVIHLASVPSVPRSVQAPLESANASIIATVTLLDAARKAGVKRVVQASSSSVYGDSKILPRVESTPPDPLSPYAVAKLTQEYYARVFFRCYGLDTISLRYFNVFGPRQNQDSAYAAVIPKFATSMLRGEQPVIFGDGRQTRDFTYVGNVVEANYRAAVAPGTMGGEAANVGSGGGIDLNQLVVLLNKYLGTDIAPVLSGPRTGDVLHSSADTSKARDLFGLQPRISFETGLETTVRYYAERAG